jgi:hypothetical protein
MPVRAQHARTILALAERFGQLPSTIAAEPAHLLFPLLELEHLSTTTQNQEVTIDGLE